jgi:hypothetical protein
MPGDGGRSASRLVTLEDSRFMLGFGPAWCIRDPVDDGERLD